MRNTLAIFFLLASISGAQTLESWTVDTDKAVPRPLVIRRGETRDLRVTFKNYSAVATIPTNASVQLWYRSADLSNGLYYVITGTVHSAASGVARVLWTAANCGTATNYTWDLVVLSNTTPYNLRAFGTIQLQAGVYSQATTATNPATYLALDWAHIINLNTNSAPFMIGDTNIYMAKADYDAGGARQVAYSNDARIVNALTNAAAFDADGAAATATNNINAAFIASKGGLTNAAEFATAAQGVAATNAQARVGVVETNTVTLSMTNGSEWGSHTGLVTRVSTNGSEWGSHANFLTNGGATINGNAISNGAEIAAWQNPASATNWTWTSDGVAITLTGYTGPDAVVVPDMLDGKPVTKLADSFFDATFHGMPPSTITSFSGPRILTIGTESFLNCAALASVSLPSVSTIGNSAFQGNTALTSVYFGENAPAEGTGVYTDTPSVTNYVTNPTATGWGSTWNGRPVVRMPVYADNFYGSGTGITGITAGGVATNQTEFFGAPSEWSVVIQNTTNLTIAPPWAPTNTYYARIANTGNVTIAPSAWPAGRYAEMLISLSCASNVNFVLPTNAARLSNGTFTYTAPSIRTNALLFFVHSPHEYWYMCASNDAPIGTP